MNALSIDIWSDIACPWCYVGKRRLEAALRDFEHGNEVHVVWHAFELDPAAPRVKEPTHSYAERLAKKYGTSPTQAAAMIERMNAVGAADDIAFDFQRIRPGNTFDAHRVLHLAKERGLQSALEERFFRGYLCEGEAIGEVSVITRLAAEVGLDIDQVSALLASDDCAAGVRSDEERARALGITGVPFFVFGQKYAVSGAQPAELLLRALETAWADTTSRGGEELAEGAVCGPDGCEV